MHNPNCRYITKTITINGVSTQVTMEIDPNENLTRTIEADKVRRQGFSGIRKGSGNMAAFRIREAKKV